MSILTRRRVQLLREIDKKIAEIEKAYDVHTVLDLYDEFGRLYAKLAKYIKNSWGDWR